MKKRLVSVILLFILITPIFVSAELQIDLEKWKSVKVWQVLDTVITYVFWGAIIAAVIFIIFAGYNFITAVGDPEKFKTAQKMLLYTLIGLLVAFSAWGLVRLIESAVMVGGGEEGERITSCSEYCRVQAKSGGNCAAECGYLWGRHFSGGDSFCPSIAPQCCCQ